MQAHNEVSALKHVDNIDSTLILCVEVWFDTTFNVACSLAEDDVPFLQVTLFLGTIYILPNTIKISKGMKCMKRI